MATHKPVGFGTSVAITSASVTTSSAISVQSDTLRVVAVGSGTFVAIGTNSSASSTDYYVPANNTATLALNPASQRIVSIITGTNTTINFPEGTGSPFNEGDYVTLTSIGQPYYNFTHQPVISVDRTSSYDGYFSTRVLIGTNTSGILTAFSSDGDLRKSVKVSSYGTGTGVLYIQQVQISGDA
jgi:hypothetical protein